MFSPAGPGRGRAPRAARRDRQSPGGLAAHQEQGEAMRVMTFVRRSGIALGVLTTVLGGPGIATASPGSDDAAPPVAAAGGAVVLSPGQPRHGLLENLSVF